MSSLPDVPVKGKPVPLHGDHRPDLTIIIDHIPPVLRNQPQWVAWRFGALRQNGKREKLPINPHTGRTAKVTDRRTWADFDTALQFKLHHPGDGIGFVFAEGDPFAGVDLDLCRDPATGDIEPWALETLAVLETYAEVSPSGTGIKAFAQGLLPGPGRHAGKIEVYDRGRFFTVTGHRLPGWPESPRDCQAQLEVLYKSFASTRGRTQERPSTISVLEPCKGTGSDDAIIHRAGNCRRTGELFRRLWSGGTSGYESPSEADLALCNVLAFWCGPDPARIDRLFRQSGLMRAKWNQRHYGDGRTYGQATIAKSLDGRTDYYRPRLAAGSLACPPNSVPPTQHVDVMQNLGDTIACPIRFQPTRSCPRPSPRSI